MAVSTLREVAIAGIGAITPRGDAASAAELRALAAGDAGSSAVIADFDLKRYAVSPKTYLDRCSALALAGCASAVTSSGLARPLEDTGRFGITLGTAYGCLGTMKSFWDKIEEKGVSQASPLLFSHSYFNSPISLCAIEWGLRGYHSTICGADSGLDAIRTAWEAIALGHADAMLCGGVDAATPERAALSGEEDGGEAALFLVLQARGLAGAAAPALDEAAFDGIAELQLLAARDTWGNCGAALSALALVQAL